MKEQYRSPAIEFIVLGVSDILTSSSGWNNGIGEDTGENEGEWM